MGSEKNDRAASTCKDANHFGLWSWVSASLGTCHTAVRKISELLEFIDLVQPHFSEG